jgi:hypothetical protein
VGPCLDNISMINEVLSDAALDSAEDACFISNGNNLVDAGCLQDCELDCLRA